MLIFSGTSSHRHIGIYETKCNTIGNPPNRLSNRTRETSEDYIIPDPERPAILAAAPPPPPPPPPSLHNDNEMATPRYGKKRSTSSGHKKKKLNKKQTYSSSSFNYEIRQQGYNTFRQTHAAGDNSGAMSSSEPFIVRLCIAILRNTTVRVNLYLIGGLAFSILGAYIQEYRRYFYTAQPKNILNEYFVKLGWGWTLGLVLPFSLICGSVFNGWRGAVAAGVRCAIATGVWCGFTTLFDVIRKNVDTNFDISGHAFILIWSNLFLVEEGKAYRGWEAVRGAASEVHNRPLLTRLIWPARVLLVAMAALSVLWDVMYFSTVLFFHTWDEKIIAISLALFNWWLIYRGLYGNIPFMPPLPSMQSVREMERIKSEQNFQDVH